jgi:Fe-S cluster assembly protein SufB
VVEIIVKKGARCRYTTIQNWSNNVYNLVTKRAVAYEGATMEWIDGNLGSKVTMKYPAVYMMGRRRAARFCRSPSPGMASTRTPAARSFTWRPRTSSDHLQVDQQGWRPRQLSRVAQGGRGRAPRKATSSATRCCSDEHSRSDTYPYIEIDEQDVTVGHEASFSKVGEEQLFYLMSRGIRRRRGGNAMIVNGFIEPLVKELPMEYAIEMNRLIQLQMEGM